MTIYLSQRGNELQQDWATIADSLDEMLHNIDTNNATIVVGTGFKNAGELKAALGRQTQIYRKLSVMAEPKDDSDRDTVRRVDKKLQSLLTNVISPEESIESY
jgi:hypothetical protein